MIHLPALRLTRPATITMVCLVAIGITASGILATRLHRPQSKTAAIQTAAKQPSDHPSTSQPKSGSSTDTSNLVAEPVRTSAADAAAAEDAKPAITSACKLLTLGVAKQLLGSGARSSSPASDVSMYQATDTSVTACAYATGSANVQLIVRAPAGQLGASENALVFGSAKPGGAVTVQGYGQSAYWDPGKHTLNILGSNNWYTISRATDTQADTEAVAKLLASGF